MRRSNVRKMISCVMAVTLSALLFGCGGSAGAGAGAQAEGAKAETEKKEEAQDTAGTEASDAAETGTDDAAAAEADTASTELMDYWGKKADDISSAFPELEKSGDSSGEEGEHYLLKDEKAADGLELAGPFFDVDKDSKVVGIGYGGTRYSLEGINTGISMQEAADKAKEKGYSFSGMEIAHGTAQIVALYENGDRVLQLTSDTEGEFGKDQESDIKGNVAKIYVTDLSEFRKNSGAEGEDTSGGAEDQSGANNSLAVKAPMLTGLENLRNENNEDGSYFYEDMTADGTTVITNMCAGNTMDEQDMEQYVSEFVSKYIGTDSKVKSAVTDEKISAALTYPAYKVSWESGSNEDSREGVGIVILTDNYTYYYGFSCSLDSFDDEKDFYEEELSGVELIGL